MQEQFYIGTADHIFSMPMPLQGDASTFSAYHNGGTLLNSIGWDEGGLLATKQRVLSFSRFSLKQSRNLNDIIFKKYGTGHIYFHDPFVENILSPYISMPYLMVDEGLPYFSRFGSISKIETPANGLGLPPWGISLELDSIDMARHFGFIVPEGFSLAYSIKGDPSSAGGFSLSNDGNIVNLPIADTTNLWDGILDIQGFCSLYADLAGDMTVYGLMLSVVPRHSTIPSVTRRYPQFISGTGMSGASMTVDSLERGEYAYRENWALDYASLTLREREWGVQ